MGHISQLLTSWLSPNDDQFVFSAKSASLPGPAPRSRNPGGCPRRTQHHAARGTSFLISSGKEARKSAAALIPEYDQVGMWNQAFRTRDPAFSINHPWNQNGKGGPMGSLLLADASHPFGGPVNASDQQVVWNSVQPRDYNGIDTTNYLLESGRHWYAGAEPRTPEVIYNELILPRNIDRRQVYADTVERLKPVKAEMRMT
ncbi:unnamed protein product [Amoebophrya sp. A120]|nr:unnamed protein product [Amoebophrya sp. A120]|eukprot:GSA120T00011655001.1